jgi:hypothetical protein
MSCPIFTVLWGNSKRIIFLLESPAHILLF